MQSFEVMNIGPRPQPVKLNIQQKIFFYCLVVTVGLFSYLIARETAKHSGSIASVSSLSTPLEPTISFYNEYTVDHPLTDRYQYTNIVEPYKVTYFQVSYASQNENIYDYVWYLDGWRIAEGLNISFTFTAPTDNSTQQVRVDVINKFTNNVDHTTQIDVSCRYVRREIRRLLQQDRIAFLQAINIIFRVPTQTGKLIYGENYRSKDYFTRLHLYYGGMKDCDHWHEGAGFVVTHFALIFMFEKTIQAINPALCLAYWDFTLESTFYDPTTFRSSQVFFDDWFGDPAPSNRYHTVSEGRWAYVGSMRNAINYSAIISTYGMLRSPWNTDITTYVTRAATIYSSTNNLKPSGCEEYANGLALRTWTEVAMTLNTYTHGHLHELMGGSWGSVHELNIPSADSSGYVNAYLFAHSTEAYSKVLWRYGWLVCPPGNTSTFEDYMDEVKDHGTHRACGCPVLRNSTYMTNANVLNDIGILSGMVYSDKNGNAINAFVDSTTGKPYTILPDHTATETQEIYEEIIGILCDIGYLGDMFQATSTNDVTFWVLHPTMERMWHLMQLNIDQGLIEFDARWDDNEETVCPGHFSYSVTPFKNLWDSNNKPYTNTDLYNLLHPQNNLFVYEHFDWPHCNFLEYNMVGY